MTQFPQSAYGLTKLNAQATYTANPGDVVLATTGTTALVVTLPPASQGGNVIVRKVDAAGTGTVTAKTADGGTVDGIVGTTGRVVGVASTVSGAELASDGTNWFTVSS